jgi:hypothetical protein
VSLSVFDGDDLSHFAISKDFIGVQNKLNVVQTENKRVNDVMVHLLVVK